MIAVKRQIYRFLIVIILTIQYSNLFAQSALFSSSEIITVDIVTDIKKLFRDIDPEKAVYHPGFISYIDSAGKSISVNVRLRTRGIFRRSRENCSIPPLTVNFKKNSNNSNLFRSIDKIKLVNVCQKRSNVYQQFLVKEYLVYEMLNALTNFSFKVRMVQIIYIDINNAVPPFKTYGFFIEEMRSLNQRTGTREVKTLGIIQEALDRNKIDLVSFFQFMIGNTDWSVPRLHNIKLVVDDKKLIPIPIPYDFDFCGFVNPPYTKPPEIIPIKDVTQRYYRGFCRSEEELRPTVNWFNQKRDTIISIIESDTLLNSKHKKRALAYIDEFYTFINNPKIYNREVLGNCRKE